jgi:Dehydrogenases with different specificities (related to short-chain alcohol dehydrogenases)
MLLLKDKIAVITGGARGIGAATALCFAGQGLKGLAIVDLDVEMADITAKEIKEKTDCSCIAIKANVANEEDVKNAFEVIINKFDTVDILVNSAGICKIIKIEEITMEQWDRTMDINVKGTFLFSRAALKIMKRKNCGRIVNVASQAGKIGGLIVGPDYPASKAGVLCLTKSLAKAAAAFNINVNSVAPGLIGTEMTSNFGYDSASVPLGRIGSPEEVADVILFLASDMSRYITGACIDVNGGMTMW